MTSVTSAQDQGAGAFQALRGARRVLAPREVGGRRVLVEVRAVDRAGNVGAAGRYLLPTPKAAPVRPRPSRRPTSRLSRNVALKYIARYAAKENKGVACQIPAGPGATNRLAADPEDFRAANLSPSVKVTLGKTPRGAPFLPFCIKSGTKDTNLGQILTAFGTFRVFNSGRTVRPARRLEYLPIVGKVDFSFDLHFDCKPDLDDRQLYVATTDGVSGTGVKINVGGTRGAPFVIDPDKGPKRVSLRLRCPSTRERHDSEINAWLKLSGYNHRTNKSSSDPDVGRGVLRTSIRGDKPSPSLAPRRTPLYNAHHIVPLRDAIGPGPGYSAYRIVVPGAFRCGLYPNSASNGVWLRSNAASRGSGPFRAIPAASGDRRRDWHGFTQNKFLPGYYSTVAKSLVDRGVLDSRSGACLKGGDAFRAALSDIERAMRRGGYLFNNHRESFK